MKKKRYILVTSLAAILLAFSACSQDEIIDGNDNLLPDGQYPLQIGSVSIVAQSSEEPWTRVVENTTDGNSSVWETGDVIGVKLVGGQSYAGGPNTFTSVGQYTVATDNGSVSLSVVPGKEVFWKNTYRIGTEHWTNASGSGVRNYGGGLTAWYPDQTDISLADQSKELSYVLKGAMPEDKWYTYESTIPLTFTHQLAKVRVALAGERVSQVTKVEVYGYTSCTNTQGTVTTDGASQGWITMHKATYTDGNTYWEANLIPGEIGNQDAQPFVRLNGTTEVPISTLTELKAGNLHTVTVKVNAYPSDATQITAENASSISGDGKYYVTGNLTSAINITGGSPHIYLYGASISAQTPISITGNSTATIHVAGDNNAVTSTSGTGILVEKGSTLILTSGSTDNVITVRGRNYNTSKDYPGIGGNHSGDCGTIRIENVTVHAYGDGTFACAPGIGPSQNYSCEGIVIKEAVVYAYGTGHNSLAAPGIGSSMHGTSAAIGAIPKMEISNSTIHAVRGGVVADFIGRAGWKNDPASSEVNPGTGGSIKSSIIHCYTGNTNTLNKTVVYDANGNGTEQSQ